MGLKDITINLPGKKKDQLPGEAAAQGKKRRGPLPTKRTINLATVNVKRINWRIAVPLMLLIVAAAAALSKFAVVDRYAELAAVEQDVALLQERLDAGYEAIDAYGTLSERYAHYSYAAMTEEEVNRVDRVETIRLLRRVVLPKIEVDMWSLNGNVLTVNVRAGRLQDVNKLARELLKEEMVDYCGVRSAATVEENVSEGSEEKVERVTAVIEAVLVRPVKEG